MKGNAMHKFIDRLKSMLRRRSVVDVVVQDLRTGGPLAQTMERTYGLKRRVR